MNQYPGKGPITVKRVLGSVVVALIVIGGMFIGGQLDRHANIQAQGGAPVAKSKQAQASTEVCRSGGSQNECKVDLMAGLVPVVYDANTPSKWRTLAQAEDAQHAGAWYDYDQGKWANAVSFQPGAIDKYKGKDMPLDLNDVAAFWVYIPRYAYEVQRRDVTDKPVKPSNFAIQFETVSSPVHQPAACQNGQGKDYRTECGLDRHYATSATAAGKGSTWATHPAFTADGKQLNGIWFAKFEATGTSQIPTVLPNQRHLSGHDDAAANMGAATAVAASLGGKSASLISAADWGAAAYLAASKYGAGFDKVQPNTQITDHTTGARATAHHSVGTTGCGPFAAGSIETYGDAGAQHPTASGALGTDLACDSKDASKSYDGQLGQLASTTGNPTGIYDMAGGGMEYATDKFNFTNMAQCTWETCGGRALYEVQSTTKDRNWLDQRGEFLKRDAKLLARGGRAGYSKEEMARDIDGDDGDGAKHGKAGLFYSGYIYGMFGMYDSVRVVLKAN